MYFDVLLQWNFVHVFVLAFLCSSKLALLLCAFTLNLSQQDIAVCFLKNRALVSITAQGSINKDQPNSLQDVTECKIS